ncbi:MAG TPA: L-threonylcarbamoyladenylate synthase [Verrucomicrobiae bacterium]|jgi:L-threonylcarbamoyladenylate synthase
MSRDLPMTLILPTHTAALFRTAVARAVEGLRAGEVVALPTETVYGLAANALEARAVARLFEIKGRPANNPVIVHVASRDMARSCVAQWPVEADELAAAFWPGPLTLVLPRSREIPDLVTAGGPTVGVRWPNHPFIQEVIRACGFPLAAPSANPSGQLSPTTAEHVRKSLGGKIRLIVDGGAARVGIESTVVDLSVMPPRVLRPGMISAESLMAALGEQCGLRMADGGWRMASRGIENEARAPLRSPGQLPKHYSPKARLVILSWRDDADIKSQIANRKSQIARTHVIAHTRVPLGGCYGGVSVIPRDAEAFARALYTELHRADDAGAELIVVEALPEGREWRAVADRLSRATAD